MGVYSVELFDVAFDHVTAGDDLEPDDLGGSTIEERDLVCDFDTHDDAIPDDPLYLLDVASFGVTGTAAFRAGAAAALRVRLTVKSRVSCERDPALREGVDTRPRTHRLRFLFDASARPGGAFQLAPSSAEDLAALRERDDE